MNQRPRFFYGYIVVFACFLIQGIGIGTYVSFAVLFKPMLAEFGWSRAIVSGSYSVAYLLMGILGVFSGMVNDRFGPRALMVVTAFFYGAGYFLLSHVQSVWQLYLFYSVVFGIGLSPIDVIPMTVTARWFVRKRGIMTGLVKTGTGAGQFSMTLLTGLLVMYYGWRHASVLLGLIAAIILAGAGLLLRRDPAQIGQLPDGGYSQAETRTKAAETGLTLREAGRTGSFWLFCIMNLLVFSCLIIIMVHIVAHGSDIGLDPLKAAGVLSTIGAMSIAGRLLAGFASDRIGTRRSMIFCLIILIAGFLWLRGAGNLWMLYLFAVVYGVAHGVYFTLISPMAAELFGIASHGAILGVSFLSGNIGGCIGPVLAGYVFDRVHSYRPVFLVMAGISAAALLLAAFLKPAVQKTPPGLKDEGVISTKAG